MNRKPKKPAPGRAGGDRRAEPPAAESNGHFWLYGHHAVAAALKNPRRSCHLLLATRQGLERLGDAARRRGVEIRITDPREIGRVVPQGAVHQGVALKVAPLQPRPLERVLAVQGAESLFLMLDQITDPRNVGAILRTALALGVQAVIVQERRSGELNAACARAAAGALDIIPIVAVTNLARTIVRLKEAGYRVTGLQAQAPIPVEELPYVPRRLLVFGSEGAGMRRLVSEGCDELARIHMTPHMESLNVSVACGIALYVLKRVVARRTPPTDAALS